MLVLPTLAHLSRIIIFLERQHLKYHFSGINDLKEKTEDGGREDYDSCESDEETIVVMFSK